MRVAVFLLIAFLAVGPSIGDVRAEEPATPAAPLVWQHEGFTALRTAAAEARKKKQRLLVGLSGSDT